MTARPSSRRVVVTGLGVISSIGADADSFAAALRRGDSGARAMTWFEGNGTDRRIGCEVVDDPRVPAGASRAARFAVAAAVEAVARSGLDVSAGHGVVAIGTTDGLAREIEVGDPIARHTGADELSSAVADWLGLPDAETVTIGSACAAGNYSLTYGLDSLVLGDADYAVVGGADSMARKTFLGFDRLGSLAASVCRPFDIRRDGILTGEGAGVLVLESLERARLRGAPVLAELRGGALTCDADHAVVPNQESLAECMRLALVRSGLTPNDVDFISAHGTGTRLNDSTETAAMHQVYGANPPPAVSVKSMLGHTMGAASALAACASVIAIRDGFIPPTINYGGPDPECDIDCVPNVHRAAPVRVVQNNSAGFGGNNCVTVFAALDTGAS